ncbi:MAG: hypothetical protein FJ134_00840 [Deltaproteobacteria bacterium]|nr:hypothetical protein [Deltaproteobacteria bacterium]
MGRQIRKLNFVIDEDVYQELEKLIPSGKRSQVVNAALRRELELIRRRKAVQSILDQEARGEKIATQEIVDALAADRGNH